MLLGNNSTYPIGLDISDLSLKMVQLNRIKNKVNIQALSKMSLPEGIISNGIIKNSAELTKAIKKMITDPLYGKVSSGEVVACLPESKTFIKLIEVQKSPNALADIVGSEIEKHVPLAVAEIYYDWQIIENLPDRYLILIGAAPKEIVSQYTALLDEAKLSPIALEIEPVAIARCLLKEEIINIKPSKAKSKLGAGLNYGIIDIGASHTCMIFYSRNTILFTISMPISGKEITAKISQALNISINQAEKAKIICGLDEAKADGVIKEIITEMINNLTMKIKEAIKYYENYFSWRGPLNHILLCGGGANIVNLAKIIKQELAIEIRIPDIFSNLEKNNDKFNELFKEKLDPKAANLKSANKEKVSINKNYVTDYTTAIGLALRGIFIDEI